MELKTKVKILTEKFKKEIQLYNILLEKLILERKYINMEKTENIMNILKEKDEIINEVNSMENELNDYKDEYYLQKKENNYRDTELEGILLEMAILIDKIIFEQMKNREQLQEKISKTRKEINNIKKRNEITNIYKNYNQENHFYQR